MKKVDMRTWGINEFKQCRDQVVQSTAESLNTRINQVYDLLTEDERVTLSTGYNPTTAKYEQFPVRLVKVILLAVADQTVHSNWNADSLKAKVSQVKRIINKRPH